MLTTAKLYLVIPLLVLGGTSMFQSCADDDTSTSTAPPSTEDAGTKTETPPSPKISTPPPPPPLTDVTAPPPPSTDVPTSSLSRSPVEGTTVPRPLVGTWNGGPGDSSDFYLTLYPEGTYRLTNDDEGLADEGYVNVTGNSMTWTSESGTRVSMEWWIEATMIGDILHLRSDGESSWVRA